MRDRVPVFAIIRVDRSHERPEDGIAIVALVPTLAEAQYEVDRMNAARVDSATLEFQWCPTRRYPEGRAAYRKHQLPDAGNSSASGGLAVQRGILQRPVVRSHGASNSSSSGSLGDGHQGSKIRPDTIARLAGTRQRRPWVSSATPTILVRRFLEAGCQVFEVDLSLAQGDQAVLGVFSQILDQPGDACSSWAAFGEALNESKVPNTVVIVTGWRGVLKRTPGILFAVTHELASISERMNSTGGAVEFIWARLT